MARSRSAILRAGLIAGASLGALGVGTVACTPAPAPDVNAGAQSNAPDYVLCNSAGCGDNVNIVIDNGQ